MGPLERLRVRKKHLSALDNPSHSQIGDAADIGAALDRNEGLELDRDRWRSNMERIAKLEETLRDIDRVISASSIANRGIAEVIVAKIVVALKGQPDGK